MRPLTEREHKQTERDTTPQTLRRLSPHPRPALHLSSIDRRRSPAAPAAPAPALVPRAREQHLAQPRSLLRLGRRRPRRVALEAVGLVEFGGDDRPGLRRVGIGGWRGGEHGSRNGRARKSEEGERMSETARIRRRGTLHSLRPDLTRLRQDARRSVLLPSPPALLGNELHLAQPAGHEERWPDDDARNRLDEVSFEVLLVLRSLRAERGRGRRRCC